jgi:acetone carboxylase gamma subunit
MDANKDAGRNVEFETVSSDKIPFGKNNFIEVARKRAVSKDGTTEFVSISRGYTMRDGTERYKSSLTIPDDEEVRQFIIEKLSSI